MGLSVIDRKLLLTSVSGCIFYFKIAIIMHAKLTILYGTIIHAAIMHTVNMYT